MTSSPKGWTSNNTGHPVEPEEIDTATAESRTQAEQDDQYKRAAAATPRRTRSEAAQDAALTRRARQVVKRAKEHEDYLRARRRQKIAGDSSNVITETQAAPDGDVIA